MANVKISELAELTTPATDDKLVIVDASEALDADKTKYITVSNLRAGPTFLTTPLTSTSWDGDSFSTTAKTLIDLSSVFGAPAGIKAALFTISLRDSASQTNDCYFYIGATDVQFEGAGISCTYINDRWNRGTLLAPCDANGDVYYELNASGSGTMDIYLGIIGYWL